MEKILQQPLAFFRPPWGALNLFQYLCLSELKLPVILWTTNASDWKIGTGTEGILNRLQRKVRPNSIIVLHDSSGDPGAPQNMLQALPTLIDYFNSRGYQFASLQEIAPEILGGRSK